MRQTMPGDRWRPAATAAADALLQVWPDPDQPPPDLAAPLRANTDALADHAERHLWHSAGHHVLFRAGLSLLNTGLAASVTTHWRHMTEVGERLLGGRRGRPSR
ncbi:hypothetical protein ABZ923_21915 [Streptomyces sp. NPDC046881]|uniref:hypothetical protein n=1 Tax=Streptomyces sp. NPDC046881 TaxID=3155374 RepID=UPI0033C25763